MIEFLTNMFGTAMLSVPEIESTSPLQSLSPEVSDYRKHLASLLQSWEKDNMLVYFNKVSDHSNFCISL